MTFRCVIFVLIACLPFAARAGAASYYLEDLTWPEVKERMRAGIDTIIIPSGGTEQNGPAIAIGKHNMIVRYTSGEIAHRLGNALAAPVLAYVPEGRVTPPQGHMLFPGTISMTPQVFAGVLEDAARSFRQHGFKYICFIGDHGGDQAPQQQVADKLNAEWKGQGVLVVNVGDYYADKAAAAWAEKSGFKNASAHAGFMDAAEVMAIDGNAVRPSHIRHYKAGDFPKDGVMGDPTGATVAYGKILLNFKVEAAVAQIRRAEHLPPGGK